MVRHTRKDEARLQQFITTRTHLWFLQHWSLPLRHPVRGIGSLHFTTEAETCMLTACTLPSRRPAFGREGKLLATITISWLQLIEEEEKRRDE